MLRKTPKQAKPACSSGRQTPTTKQPRPEATTPPSTRPSSPSVSETRKKPPLHATAKPRRRLPDYGDGIWYAETKLSIAVATLATSRAPIRERLRDAFVECIAVLEDDLPERARPSLEAFRTRATWSEATKGDEGTLEATLRAISDDEAHKLARLLVDAYQDTINHLLSIARFG